MTLGLKKTPIGLKRNTIKPLNDLHLQEEKTLFDDEKDVLLDFPEKTPSPALQNGDKSRDYYIKSNVKDDNKSSEEPISIKSTKYFMPSALPTHQRTSTDQEQKFNNDKRAKNKKGDLEWNPRHFRLFVGNLGAEVTEETLQDVFGREPFRSFVSARVIKSPNANRKGSRAVGIYGFVAFESVQDYLLALREYNGHYIGNRPCVLKKAAAPSFNNHNNENNKNKSH